MNNFKNKLINNGQIIMIITKIIAFNFKKINNPLNKLKIFTM